MESKSPSARIRDLDNHTNQILRRFDVYKLGSKARAIVSDLKQNLIDSRIYINSYELAEEREQQLKDAKIAKKWLSRARRNILAASEYDIFSAIDVAQLTAIADQIKADLK